MVLILPKQCMTGLQAFVLQFEFESAVHARAEPRCDSWQGRSPLDHLSSKLSSYLAGAAETEVYSWGNGANYQLGSGAVGLQLAPVRLEAFRDVGILAVAAAKFHSAALTSDGQLYTWGFGRGGRLGEQPNHWRTAM